MNAYAKVALSITGIFLGGMTGAYQADHATTSLGLVMSGLAPVGAYLIGYYQINPANQPKEPTP